MALPTMPRSTTGLITRTTEIKPKLLIHQRIAYFQAKYCKNHVQPTGLPVSELFTQLYYFKSQAAQPLQNPNEFSQLKYWHK